MDKFGRPIPKDDNLYRKELSEGWSFRQTDDVDGKWLPVKKVPSTVHQDLIDNNLLKDPFIGFNEIEAEWVGTKSWTYRTSFDAPEVKSGRTVELTFNGLDTFAHVKLNGEKILESDNMFLSHQVDVTDTIVSQGQNTLEIEFDSAFLKGREIKAKHPEHKFVGIFGDMGRLAVRKAQYHWGWDWGPVLVCAGIWRPIHLEIFHSKVSFLRVDQVLSADLKSVMLYVTVAVESDPKVAAQLDVMVSVSLGAKEVITRAMKCVMRSTTLVTLIIDEPHLWMPNGYGEQTLYDVQASVISGGDKIHSKSCRIGIRRVELVQRPDKYGKSFFFRINNVDVFCGGSCWIPSDSFLTNVTPARLHSWIELMALGNQKMIRVWGGGIYEEDAFYDACDELGILVWQDFMFACGNYPAYPAFLDSVREEAMCNLERLRHHPCLAILAGNNEDYQIQEQFGLTCNYRDENEENWLRTNFPARYIYEYLLPDCVRRACPDVPYHPSSPWGDKKISSDPTVGDIHQWNVWHGTQQKYQIFDAIGGRFNSEFGLEAFLHIGTIRSFVQDEEDLYPQSHVIDFHNKADGHERRIATYLIENVRMSTNLEAYIHLTQLVQCEALTFGYRGWRRQWGYDRKCGGALVWQLNDCWPVTSWAICDYYQRRKPAYYAIARILAPLAVGIRREHHDWSVTHARQPKTQKWELWAVSSKLHDVIADIEVKFISVKNGLEIKEKMVKKGIKVTANGTTDIASGHVDNLAEEPHVLAARIWVDGNLIARDTDWPQPLKYLPFPNRQVNVEVQDDKMHVSVQRPVKCLVFEEREGIRLSDSGIDLVPGDTQVIQIHGMAPGDPPLNWTCLGAGEQ